MSLKLELEVERLTRIYVRKGGKDNRKQQRARMLDFARHSARMGANSLGQVGHGHVIKYWKVNVGLADATLYNHWLAIRELFHLAGKPLEPPKPFTKEMTAAMTMRHLKERDGLISASIVLYEESLQNRDSASLLSGSKCQK